MNRLFSAKPLLAAAVALGAVGAASAAHAGTDVFFSVGFAQPAYVAPAPVYVRPAPVYVQPAPVYVQPEPVYLQPRPVYVEPRVTYYGYGRYVERRGPWGEWREARAERRDWGWRDADRDGVPNRFDRAPYDPYRR